MQGRCGPAGPFPGFRAVCLPGAGPTPQHPTPWRPCRRHRGDQAAASPPGDRSRAHPLGSAYGLPPAAPGGLAGDHKRVHQLWREEGLQRPSPRKQKRARPADGSVRRHQSQYPYQVWAMDFQFDTTADGQRLKFLNVINEHSRLCLAIRVGRRCKSKDVVSVLDELTSLYPAPTYIPTDNGPEFIAHALKRWCKNSNTSTAYIEPGSPWQNGFAESFNSRFRDEFLNTELFATVAEAQGLADRWRWDYNTLRPHSALQGRTPLEAAQPVAA